jgi:cell division protein ZapA
MACDVEIFGQTYSLRADTDDEQVRRVAALVDRKMREVAAGSRSVSTMNIAVLAALDLASEVLQSQTEMERIGSEVAIRSEALTRRIAAVIPGAGAS